MISAGANGALIAYDLNGKTLGDYVGHTGEVWSVAPSADGKYLVSASDDQTVRLWNLRSRELLLTIFEGTDGSWIAWTPQGYYVGSDSGADRIGWLLNYGAEKTPGFVKATQIGNLLYRPDLIARAVKLGSVKKAIDVFNKAAKDGVSPIKGVELPKLPRSISETLSSLPPQLRLLVESVETGGTARLRFAVRRHGRDITDIAAKLDAPGGAAIDLAPVRLTPNAADREAAADLDPGEELLVIRVKARSGENRVTTRVRTAVGASEAVSVTFDVIGDGALGSVGALRILAIGVNSYLDATAYADLAYAAKDAKAFAATAKARLGPFYGKGTDVRVLASGGDALPTTANIARALDWLGEAKEEDTTLVFFSGHGLAGRNDYFLLPRDFKKRGGAKGENVIAMSKLWARLARTAGRKAVFLDSCRSGDAFGERLEFRAGDANAGILTSAGRNDLAFEDPKLKHGRFTYALLEVLRNKGGAVWNAKGELWSEAMSAYVIRRVSELSDGGQTPRPFLHPSGRFRFAGS